MNLRDLSGLADELFAAKNTQAHLESQLAEAKERVRRLEEERIPTAMEAAGLSSFRTPSGFTISVAERIRCKQLERADGLAWLREHGQGGLIRSSVVVPFAQACDEKARELMKDLAAKGIEAKHEAKVLHQSLAAAIREMMEKGEDVPLEVLGAYIQKTTQVTT